MEANKRASRFHASVWEGILVFDNGYLVSGLHIRNRLLSLTIYRKHHQSFPTPYLPEDRRDGTKREAKPVAFVEEEKVDPISPQRIWLKVTCGSG